jgi:hypothetical protein
MKRFAVFALLAGLACSKGRAGPPEQAIALPSDTLEAEWSEVPVAAPAAGGHWVVVSPEWNAAVIADFQAKSLTPLGGAKQTAYLNPFMVSTFADTILLADWGKRRTTVWSPEGRLIDSIPLVLALRGAYPRARDAAGQLYFQVDPVAGRDGSGNQDSIAVVRAPRSLTRFDTIAHLAPREMAAVTVENATRFEQRVYSGADVWGVWPEGTLWIARRFRNQVITVSPRGEVHKGPELPDPVYEVTQADRDRYLQAYPVEVRPKETDLAWAVVFPPFTTAFPTRDGLWLEKTKQALDSLRRIQVLDRDGALRRVLVIRGQARLIAVGTDKLLLGEQFAKGVRLMEVRIPAPAAPTP